MPSDNDSYGHIDQPPNGEDLQSVRPPPTEVPYHAQPKTLQALADGAGVYTASASSPFLMAPPISGSATLTPASDAVDAPVILVDELRHLTEPLRRQVRAVPLRLRLTEDEVSGLVAAVLDLIARHLPIGGTRARRKH